MFTVEVFADRTPAPQTPFPARFTVRSTRDSVPPPPNRRVAPAEIFVAPDPDICPPVQAKLPPAGIVIVPLPVTSPEAESAAEMLRPTVLESAAMERDRKSVV